MARKNGRLAGREKKWSFSQAPLNDMDKRDTHQVLVVRTFVSCSPSNFYKNEVDAVAFANYLI